MPQVYKETENIKDLGFDIQRCNAPFDQALVALGSRDIITASQLAYARIIAGSEHSLSQYGSYTKEGSLFVPKAKEGRRRLLLSNSLALENPVAATEAHRKGQEYSLGKDFNVERFLGQLKEDEDYFVIDDLSQVPVERFGEDERTVWLFKEHAKEYGLFLKDAGVKNIGFYLYTNNDKHIGVQTYSFANQLWLGWIGDVSNVISSCMSVNRIYAVRRVVQKISQQEIAQPQERTAQQGELYSKEKIIAEKNEVASQIAAPTLEKILADKTF